jgi:hypothetical protein
VKKSVLALTVLAIMMVVFFTSIANFKTVMAAPDYDITRVDHTVKVLSNGFVLINDTVTTSASASGPFLIGFPYKYGLKMLHCIAYGTSDRSSVYPVTLNVPLENHVGFYGVRVDLPDGAPQAFTVEFILSNSLLTQDSQNATVFTLDFPAYPSFTKAAALCKGLVSLPLGATYVRGTLGAFNYTTDNLAAFSYNASEVTFASAENTIQLFEIKQLERQMTVNEFGDIGISDSYHITNNAQSTMVSVDVILPRNSTVPTAKNQLGLPTQILLIDSNPIKYRVDLTLRADPGKSSEFIVLYSLDKNAYSTPQNEAGKSAYKITQFDDLTYYVDQVSVTLSLPEGAKLSSRPVTGFYGVGKGPFADEATIQKQDFVWLDSFPVEIVYEYNPVWTAFRPTLWVWSIALVGCAIFAVSRRLNASVTVIVPSRGARLRPENLKTFVDSCEEKMKIRAEIDALEARVQKGKIPRRRYKVQKKTLEMRVDTLSRNLGELKESMRSAGGHYADLMRQFDVAETEINDVEANIKNIEARQNRGEITLELYRNRMEEYRHRKEKAETMIDGILLRLREETR